MSEPRHRDEFVWAEALRRIPHPWLLVALGFAVLAVGGAFSTSRLYYVRDLSMYFWPHMLWLRQTIFGGELPLWDPNPGWGYPVIADVAQQILFLPTLPFRLLFPDVLGFNLAVAFPYPIAAVGTYLFLRRRFVPQAAALGGIAFALGGPLLSASNCMNLSTTGAMLPWVLWSVDALAYRPTPRAVALLGLLFALDFFAGEPVVFVFSSGLALAYAALAAGPQDVGWRSRARATGLTLAAGGIGALISAVQLLPLVDQTRRSIRGAHFLGDGWSLHPLRLVESVAPRVFGSPLDTLGEYSQWVTALSEARTPYLFSVYVGVTAVALAALGVASPRPRRWVLFWLAGFAAFLLLAVGYNTPVYETLRDVVPGFKSFRYPTKHAVIAAFAFSVLAASGFQALATDALRSRVAWGVAACAALAAASLAVLAYVVGFPDAASEAFASLAAQNGHPFPDRGGAYLVRSCVTEAPRLLALSVGTAVCLWAGREGQRHGPRVRTLVLFVLAFDLLATNRSLLPTLEAATFREPRWVAVVRQHPEDRVFIARQYLPGFVGVDEDKPPDLPWSPKARPVDIATVVNAEVPVYPTPWGVRNTISFDLTGLRPVEYLWALQQFSTTDRAARFRFLAAAGTRYFIVPRPPPGEAALVQPVEGLEPLALYEGGAPTGRARVVTGAVVAPDVRDHIVALFDGPLLRSDTVMLDAPPPEPSGTPGPGDLAAASILEERRSRVSIRASAPAEGGYLVLTDSFDPNWVATVDGGAASILRANGLFRAVRIAPGTHTIVFEYRSRWFLAGAWLSGLGILLFVALAVRKSASRATSEEGNA
jgi:hypothetical protein